MFTVTNLSFLYFIIARFASAMENLLLFGCEELSITYDVSICLVFILRESITSCELQVCIFVFMPREMCFYIISMLLTVNCLL